MITQRIPLYIKYKNGKIYIPLQFSWSGKVICVDITGQLKWTYIPSNSYDRPHSIVYGEDGNLYVGGMTGHAYLVKDDKRAFNDILVISLDTLGNQRWRYTYDGPYGTDDFEKSIVYGADGKVYIGGTIYYQQLISSFIVICLDTLGNQEWIFTFQVGYLNKLYSITYGMDGNLYIAGTCSYSTPGGDFIILSITNTGELRWIFEGDNGIADTVIYGADGNVYAKGIINNEYVIVSLTNFWRLRWTYPFNASSITYGEDGNLYVTGSLNEDFIILSLTNTGQLRWSYSYNGSGNGEDKGSCVIYGNDGNIYAGGSTTGVGTGFDITIISLNPQPKIKEIFPPSYSFGSPIPFFFHNNSIKYQNSQVTLYNPCGMKKNLQKSKNLPSGIYFLKTFCEENKKINYFKLIKF